MSKEITIQILQVAKSKLTPESWFQNAHDFGDGGYVSGHHFCFFLALAQAETEVVQGRIGAGKELCAAVIPRLEKVASNGDYGPGDTGQIVDWNDVPGRTLQQVHSKIDEVIASLQSEV